jgi:hypothetical protein
MAMSTHQVVDFGTGHQDETLGYPFEGTEQACSAWIDKNQQECYGRDRFALQEVPGDEL